MKIGLVGFAGSGKTTVFNTLTGMNVPTGLAGGGQVHLGTVKVPDPRIDKLSAIFKPKKTTYAEITFSDIPGEHSAEQHSISRKALEPIRTQDVLCLVVRAFDNPALETKPDAAKELEAFHAECILADLDMVERKLDRSKKEKTDPLDVAAFELAKKTLEHELPLRALPESALHRDHFKGFALLTDRPLLVVVNRAEGDAAKPLEPAFEQRLKEMSAGGIALSASVEAEIAQMEPADQKAFLDDLGLAESARNRFIHTAYRSLDLISFFTVGEDEVRAWPISRGLHARGAAGKIHSDLERGFIRAEIIPYDVFMKHGSEHAVRETGGLKVEGKDYVMQDGDIVHVRFNV